MSDSARDKALQNHDIIVAECTPPGRAAISLVRLSGPGAAELASKLHPDIATQASRRAYLRTLRHDGQVLDEAIVTVFPAPRSYTGQDTVEISLHGNPLIVGRVISALIQAGARSAEPGEFTRRAYLNGRLPLVRAEAVAQLIHAESDAALRAARRLYEGGLEKRLEKIRAALLDLLAEVEALIDFVEEDIEPRELKVLHEDCQALNQQLHQLLGSLAQGRILSQGISVAIAGLPNAGKSSLLNALAQRDRAIVAPTPGTTRDTIEVALQWDGIAIRLIDTAGLRDTADPVEQEGVRRSREALAVADIILWVSDATVPADVSFPPQDIISSTAQLIHVINKTDLLAHPSSPSDNLAFKNNSDVPDPLCVSALTGLGIAELRARIITKALGTSAQDADALTIHEHHQATLRQAHQYLAQAAEALRSGLYLDLCAIDLRSALSAISSITERVDNEELLGAIFSRFCIGK